MSELKPCPFCGGDAYLADAECGRDGMPMDFRNPRCKSCGCDFGYDKIDHAIERWNRRTHPQPVTPAAQECDHDWRPDADVMNAWYCPKCDVTRTKIGNQPVTPAGGEVGKWKRLDFGRFGGTSDFDVGGVTLRLTYDEACIVDGIVKRVISETHPPVAYAALVRTLEHCRDWFESQAKVISKGCGSSWNIVQCHEQRDLIDGVLAALNQRGGG